jgi:hypothetical protein
MKARLILSLIGVYLTEVDVELPDHDECLSFEDNCKIRESYLNHEVETLRIRHLNAILKYNCVHEINLVVASKMNVHEKQMDFS